MTAVAETDRTTRPIRDDETQYCEAIRPSAVAPLQGAMDKASQTPINSIYDPSRRWAWEAALARGVDAVTAILIEFPPKECEGVLPATHLPAIRRPS